MVTKAKRIEFLKKLEDISIDMRSKTIYRSKFGLDDGVLKSNAEVGRIFSLSGEYIRQVLEKVIEQIGSPVE